MRWDVWETQYRAIVSRFSYDTDDELTARIAGSKVAGDSPHVLKGDDAVGALSRAVRGKCLVTGAGPSLEREVRLVRAQLSTEDWTLVAADGSCGLLGREGLMPDIIVTDLDGDVDEERKMNSNGALMVIHFHGDNYEVASEFVKSLKGSAVITTQAGPTVNTFNFGGYTDGDRAVLLCEEFGAKRVILAGFDFGSVLVEGDTSSLEKLNEAKRIVEEAKERGMEITRP